RQRTNPGSVAIHDIELGVVIVSAGLVMSQIGDHSTVRRHLCTKIGAAPSRERVQHTTRNIDGIDLGIRGMPLRACAPVRREQYRASIGAPRERIYRVP